MSTTSHLMVAEMVRQPTSRLFVEPEVYDVLSPLELAVACYWIGDDTRASGVNRDLLRSGKLSPELRQRVEANLEFSKERQRSRRIAA